MELSVLIEELGYSGSRNFLQRGTAAFNHAPDIGHILRAAARNRACRLEGVYTLRPFNEDGSLVPVVYVCDAESIAAANEIHKLVWNQDITPFLLVRTPGGVCLYSGFKRNWAASEENDGVLEPLIQFDEIAEKLAEFRGPAIDSGELWRKRAGDVQPDKRVYWSLLENLKQLARKFSDHFGAATVKSIIHPLIGKYVYLHYLKDRGFLSPRRLEEWQIEHNSVFTRNATVAGLRAVCGKLDDFLNGRVFPLKFSGPDSPTEEQIQHIAGAFAGDSFDGEWQFHLPFTAFKFDFIPIETLSMIYEQFLHLPDKPDSDEDDELSEGRKAGAYYTPIPVVNYMLAEMDKRRRLQRGVRVWDPSCGSGAFLVQCFRRLVEREFVHRRKKPAPHELATLLKRHIFGVDRDQDACSVAEFSLYLTLLDYLEPRDLIDHPRFRLPTLRRNNIFCADFFKVRSFKTKFHWVIGNPPWTKPKGEQAAEPRIEGRHEPALKWMGANTRTMPVGKNSVAQAFAWRCQEFLVEGGECGLLMPAMTLFEDYSQRFRSAFFRAQRMYTVANFSNLAEVLFAGRSRVPAAALFFGPRKKGAPDDFEITTVFSPFVANQEGTRPTIPGLRHETWSITGNGDEIRELPYCEIASGDALPWKIAFWGSALDASLLERMRRRWDSFESLEAVWSRKKSKFIGTNAKQVFGVSEGIQLRIKGAKKRKNEKKAEDLDEVVEVRGKMKLEMKQVDKLRRLFRFTDEQLTPVLSGKKSKQGVQQGDEAWCRKGRGLLPLTVCRAPHVIVGETRNFAVFSGKFLVVPPRQIGIVSLDGNYSLLKALSLYLSSDFALYHQFFFAPCFGVKRPIATLKALRQIPIPILSLSDVEVAEWERLHDQLASTSPRLVDDLRELDPVFGAPVSSDGQEELVRRLNHMVNTKLGLDEVDQVIVHDLVHVRMSLDDGNVGNAAVRDASGNELSAYAKWLQRELDPDDGGIRHSVTILYDKHSGFIAIEPAAGHAKVRIVPAGSAGAQTLSRTREKLREERAQWVYFDRSLRLHEGRSTFLFKPLQRMHWTRSRAMLDAADIVIGSMRGEAGRGHDE